MYCPGYISETVKCRKLYLIGTSVGGCRCATSLCDLGVTFDFRSARIFSTAIFETYFSYQRKKYGHFVF